MTTPVQAEVLRIVPSLESVLYVTVVLRFRNSGATPVRVQRYRVIWAGGTITASPASLVLRPGDDREWLIRIDPSHGSLDALWHAASASARVDVLEVGSVE